MPEEISTKEYLSELHELIDSLGSIAQAAKKMEVSRQHMWAAEKGIKLPGKKILKYMKLTPVKEKIKYRYARIEKRKG